MPTILLPLALACLGQVGADPAADPSAAFFAGPAVPRIEIRLEPDQLDRLRAEPRAYVRASVREDGRDLPGHVALKLKGAAGSFREWDDRPALTLSMRKFRKGGTFHGLAKFHLNNSVQDESYCKEMLASELFRRAGVPAPRVGFARVSLDGRDVGLYVLKEGFDRPFLDRSFADPTGNLYDGGFLQDIDADLEKDEGSGPDDRSDLRAIVEALGDPDLDRRRDRLAALVDLDAFCTFMALERMIAHWDGYSSKANNYRIYFDPRRGRAVFLPHGMDQIFEDPAADLFEPSGVLVAREILESDALRQRYRERLAALIPLMAPADPLLGRVDAIDARLRPVLLAIDPAAGPRRDELVADLKRRLIARADHLRQQIAAPDSPLQPFDDRNAATPADWWPEVETDGAIADEVDLDDGRKALHIQAGAGQPCVASWRTRVLLGPGDYSIRAQIRTEDVVKLDDSDRAGVGVGRSGVGRDQHRLGTIAAEELTCSFHVPPDRRQVVLVLELRARSGQVWFPRESIRLIRHPPAASP